jgi:methylthioribose-1-phosphate isomerase
MTRLEPIEWQPSQVRLLNQHGSLGEYSCCQGPNELLRYFVLHSKYPTPLMVYGGAIAAYQVMERDADPVRAFIGNDAFMEICKAVAPPAFIEGVRYFRTFLEEKDPSLWRTTAARHVQRYLLDLDAQCHIAGRHGAALLPEKEWVLLFGSYGALRFGGYGTATGVVRASLEEGKEIKVFVTHPEAHWELQQYHLESTLVSVEQVPFLISSKQVTAVVTGVECVARTGDVLGLPGVYGAALAAHAENIPCLAVGLKHDLDLTMESGESIVIKEVDVPPVPGQPAPLRYEYDLIPAKLLRYIILGDHVYTAPFDMTAET